MKVSGRPFACAGSNYHFVQGFDGEGKLRPIRAGAEDDNLRLASILYGPRGVQLWIDNRYGLTAMSYETEQPGRRIRYRRDWDWLYHLGNPGRGDATQATAQFERNELLDAGPRLSRTGLVRGEAEF